MVELLSGYVVAASISDENSVVVKKSTELNSDTLSVLPMQRWHELSLVDGEAVEERVAEISQKLGEREELIKRYFADKIDKIKRGDDLQPGVIKMVKIYIAIKRKLSVGDKMAGRHGNKGVLSRILPEEDMPYTEDGTPVEIVLNPLGVPSRMNVGQILEIHLGLAARGLGNQIQDVLNRQHELNEVRETIKDVYEDEELNPFLDDLPDADVMKLAKRLAPGVPMASPVFEGVSEAEIKRQIARSGFSKSGQLTLYNGKTGEAFKEQVTVGIMYMLKLHHLVDDKIHARSIGPYSLVTQQPLGGKAQFGGQRLGEMEVWAMEAYGASHALQEFLTVKSDDVAGRTRMYEAIVKGRHTLEAGLPESFNVLIKELQALCLDVELQENE